jgi:biopolymer transport protein ExbB/TolQ
VPIWIKNMINWYNNKKAISQLNRKIAENEDLDLDIKKVKRFKGV